jgi:folate-binding protein YgfZ
MAERAPNFDEQYEALRGGAGVVELTDWSSVAVIGADRHKFLHNFCTNDVNSLTPGDSCEAFFTNAKGRILGHGHIDCRDDELVFIGTPEQAPRLIEHLDRYIIRDDVQLRDTSDVRNYFHAPMLPAAPAARSIGVQLLGAESGTLLEVATDDQRRAREMWQERGYVACGMAAFEAARIEAGTPLFGVDFNEQNFPQEVNRDRQAVSFTKGCYLGQETVARIDALGHVNQKLVGVRFSGREAPAAGMELLKNGTRVGQVTSAAYSPQLGASVALAMVRREANAPGTQLESPIGGCEVIQLPVNQADG